MEQSRFVSTDKLLIAVPCSAESLEQVLLTAKSLDCYPDMFFRAGLWKPRTMPSSFEGVGSKGLMWLREVKRLDGLKVCTEVASPNHVEQCLDAEMDALWIGARTTTNPFSVQDIADALSGTDIPIFVKNPLNPDVKLWIGAVERLYRSGCRNICAVHRGFCLADNGIYRNSPLWQVAIEFRRLMPQTKLICDPSHIAGRSELVFDVSQTAMNLCFDGLMIEVHSDPLQAKTDAKQQLSPVQLHELLSRLQLPHSNDSQSAEDLELLRGKIDQTDAEIVSLLAQRMEIVRQLSEVKHRNNMSILQIDRWKDILQSRMQQADKLHLNSDFVKDIFEQIHRESVALQDKIAKSH